MNTKRILVINSQLLAGEGIQMMLAKQDQYEVIDIDPLNCADLARLLREHQAEVVVVDEQNLFCKQKNLIGFFPYQDNSCDLPDFRLVVVSAQDNCVKVVYRREVQINQLADFFAIL